jgi:hypothetical protein
MEMLLLMFVSQLVSKIVYDSDQTSIDTALR